MRRPEHFALVKTPREATPRIIASSPLLLQQAKATHAKVPWHLTHSRTSLPNPSTNNRDITLSKLEIMPLMDFLRALSPIGAASSTAPATAAPLDATAGKRYVSSLPPSLHIHKATNLTPHGNNLKGHSPASSTASSGSGTKKEGEKSWENAWEMKRMLKVTVSV